MVLHHLHRRSRAVFLRARNILEVPTQSRLAVVLLTAQYFAAVLMFRLKTFVCYWFSQQGNEPGSVADLKIADTLYHYMVGGHKKPQVRAWDDCPLPSPPPPFPSRPQAQLVRLEGEQTLFSRRLGSGPARDRVWGQGLRTTVLWGEGWGLGMWFRVLALVYCRPWTC